MVKKVFNTMVNKLDGVGPVDNRPSTNKLHQFVKKKQKNMWHVTRDKAQYFCNINLWKIAKYYMQYFWNFEIFSSIYHIGIFETS